MEHGPFNTFFPHLPLKVEIKGCVAVNYTE